MRLSSFALLALTALSTAVWAQDPPLPPEAEPIHETASGLRYVLYAFMTALEEPWRVIYEPGGYLLAPDGEEYIGDVLNVIFSCGWIAGEGGTLYIYYASSDTRCHVATSTVERLVDSSGGAPADYLRELEQRLVAALR